MAIATERYRYFMKPAFHLRRNNKRSPTHPTGPPDALEAIKTVRLLTYLNLTNNNQISLHCNTNM